MCGFGGIIGNKTISLAHLSYIAAQVNYRGPDYTGLRLFEKNFSVSNNSGSFGIFHNRLSIIDHEVRSNQPFEDERYLLVFNGEIYNFRKIRSDLIDLGYNFCTKSDTEVLFIALKHWGVDYISKLNGMFSFAFIDKKERYVILARDRAGIKPLYYALKEKSILFASEADTIIRLLGNIPCINMKSVAQYNILQYIPGDKTIWSGINKLQPGNYIKIEIDHCDEIHNKPIKYWDPYEVAKVSSTPICLKELLSKVVSEHLVADVPVGVSLSSGVDSSLLAALINRNHEEAAVKFFSVGFTDLPENDESIKAKKFLEKLGVKDSSFIRLTVDSRSVGALWENLYQKVDEPFGDHAILLNCAISTEASKHVKVMLTGDGADEIFAGYDRYREWDKYDRLSKATIFIMKIISIFTNNKKINIWSESNPIIRYIMLLDPGVNSAQQIKIIFEELIYSLLMHDIIDRKDLMRLIDLKMYLPGAMLYKVDRSSMAAGIEVRVPFLDNQIIDTGLNISSLDKTKNLKWRLREVLGEIAPHYDLMAPKRGLSLPLFLWMRENWKTLLHEIFNDADYDSLGLDKRENMKILKSFYSGNNAVGHQLWIRANLILWHRTKLNQFRY